MNLKQIKSIPLHGKTDLILGKSGKRHYDSQVYNRDIPQRIMPETSFLVDPIGIRSADLIHIFFEPDGDVHRKLSIKVRL